MVCCFGAVLRGTRGAATTAHSSRQHLEVDVRGDSRRADRLRARWATSECNHDGSCQSLRHNSCRRDCQRWCVWQSRSPNASDRVGAGGSRLASNKNLTRGVLHDTDLPSLPWVVCFLSFFLLRGTGLARTGFERKTLFSEECLSRKPSHHAHLLTRKYAHCSNMNIFRDALLNKSSATNNMRQISGRRWG